MRQKRNEVTWIERDVYEALERLGVAYERQVRLGRFRVDAFVRDRNLVIECNGDFWHCNPEVFPDGPTCSIQEQAAPFGRRRVDWLRANGYRVAVLWERDIRREGAEPLVRRALDDIAE